MFVPDWMRTETVYSRDTATATSATSWSTTSSRCATSRTWARSRSTSGARGSPTLERPDWLVLDLDPKGAPFTDVVEVARPFTGSSTSWSCPSYLKTSGATGLHILIPLGARYTHERGADASRDCSRAHGRGARARDLDRGAPDRRARRQGVRRLRPERPRQHDRRRRSRCGRCPARPARARSLGRGDGAARSRAASRSAPCRERFARWRTRSGRCSAQGIDMAAAIARIEARRPRARRRRARPPARSRGAGPAEPSRPRRSRREVAARRAL